jgi:hypothetical protein
LFSSPRNYSLHFSIQSHRRRQTFFFGRRCFLRCRSCSCPSGSLVQCRRRLTRICRCRLCSSVSIESNPGRLESNRPSPPLRYSGSRHRFSSCGHRAPSASSWITCCWALSSSASTGRDRVAGCGLHLARSKIDRLARSLGSALLVPWLGSLGSLAPISFVSSAVIGC